MLTYLFIVLIWFTFQPILTWAAIGIASLRLQIISMTVNTTISRRRVGASSQASLNTTATCHTATTPDSPI